MKKQPMFSVRKRYLSGCLSVCLCGAAVSAENGQEVVDLYTQIDRLAKENHFVVKGIAKLSGAQAATNSKGNVRHRLEQLLVGYNHIIIQNKRSGIERLIILDKKSSQHVARIIAPVVKRQGHYFVQTSIMGDDNAWIDLELLIDTGADVLVLPLSMLDKLGLAKQNMRKTRLQTINGKVSAFAGQLQAVAIADEVVENVAVAFVKDNLIGKHSLLGMSFLDHYRFTIDDQLQQIVLIKK